MSLDDAAIRNRLAEVEGEIKKLKANAKLMQDAFGEFIEAHNRAIVGCQLLEAKIDAHLKAPVEMPPAMVEPKGDG